MKNKAFLIIMIALLFTGCSTNGDTQDLEVDSSIATGITTPSEFDEAENEMLDLDTYSVINEPTEYPQTGYTHNQISRGEAGYYFEDNGKLRCFDMESKTIMTVCNKPNCKHDDDACVANTHFTEWGAPRLNIGNQIYYKGYVYFFGVDGLAKIYRISGDGSSREECTSVIRIDEHATSFTYPKFTISRDTMFFINPDENKPCLRKLELGQEEATTIFASDNTDGIVYRPKAYGDFVFFQAGTMIEGEATAGIYAYNMKTEETKLVLKDAIAEYDIVGDNLIYDFDGGFYSYNLRTGEHTKIVEQRNDYGFVNNDKYLVIKDTKEVYTLTGDYVCKLALDEVCPLDIIGMDEDYIIAKDGGKLLLKSVAELDDKPFEEYSCED